MGFWMPQTLSPNSTLAALNPNGQGLFEHVLRCDVLRSVGIRLACCRELLGATREVLGLQVVGASCLGCLSGFRVRGLLGLVL